MSDKILSLEDGVRAAGWITKGESDERIRKNDQLWSHAWQDAEKARRVLPIAPVGFEYVPGEGWVSPGHPEHPDHERLKDDLPNSFEEVLADHARLGQMARNRMKEEAVEEALKDLGEWLDRWSHGAVGTHLIDVPIEIIIGDLKAGKKVWKNE